MQKNKEYIDYLKNFGYMKNIDRKDRVKETQEVFTPINACLDLVEYTMQFNDNMLTETVFDNTMGDGEWLGAVLIKRLESGIDLEEALKNLKGSDLQNDNVVRAKERLSCGRNDLTDILDKNLCVADATKFHYRFDGSHPYDDEVKEQERQQHLEKLFEGL